MARKYNNKTYDTKEIAEFFSMKPIDVYKNIYKGNRLDLVYTVLSNDKLTTKQKRTYLFYNTSMSEKMKDKLWERYFGDYGYAYCKATSISLEFEIIQEGGSV